MPGFDKLVPIIDTPFSHFGPGRGQHFLAVDKGLIVRFYGIGPDTDFTPVVNRAFMIGHDPLEYLGLQRPTYGTGVRVLEVVVIFVYCPSEGINEVVILSSQRRQQRIGIGSSFMGIFSTDASATGGIVLGEIRSYG